MNTFVYFYYRTCYENPLGRRVIRLEVPNILAWFQRGWKAVHELGADPYEWVEKELSGSVYGLSSIFGYTKDVPMPRNNEELAALLKEYSYVYDVRADNRTLRGFTDDDEIDLAYYFFESSYAVENPSRVKYLLTEIKDFPAKLTEPPPLINFVPATIELESVEPAHDCSGSTLYCCFLSYEDGMTITDLHRPFQIKDLTLPKLGEYLWATRDLGGKAEEEITLMRALIRSSRDGIGDILERCVPLLWTDWYRNHRFKSPEDCRKRIAACGPSASDHQTTIWHNEDHFFLATIYYSNWQRFQYFLFDDIWASSHPDLAQSILKFAYTWDPFSEEL